MCVCVSLSMQHLRSFLYPSSCALFLLQSPTCACVCVCVCVRVCVRARVCLCVWSGGSTEHRLHYLGFQDTPLWVNLWSVDQAEVMWVQIRAQGQTCTHSPELHIASINLHQSDRKMSRAALRLRRSFLSLPFLLCSCFRGSHRERERERVCVCVGVWVWVWVCVCVCAPITINSTMKSNKLKQNNTKQNEMAD